MNKAREAPGGRSVLPLSTSTLSLSHSNEAELVKSNSVIQNTPQNFLSGNRAEISTPGANTNAKQGFRSRRKGFRWGTGTWIYPHSLWDPAVNCQDADQDIPLSSPNQCCV